MTQQQVADYLSVNRSTYSGYETGKREPSITKLKTLANLFRLSVDTLLETDIYSSRENSYTGSDAELQYIKKYRALDEHGKNIVNTILDIEATHSDIEKNDQVSKKKTIPLYGNPAAAGSISPVAGIDYVEYEVNLDCRADFATRIQGDSMEPYIKDGSIVLVKRQNDLKEGDVGVFYVDGCMICKQYFEDTDGNIHLFSLNRDRRDADLTIWASSKKPVLCYGKVVMDKHVPLPKE